MTITARTTYDQFLDQVTAALVSAGSQSLLPPESHRSNLPDWAQEWDRLLLLNSPGSLNLFAFRRGNVEEVDRLRTLLDDLVRGLSARGILAGGLPFNLIAVPVFPDGVSSPLAKGLTRLTPSQYFPGVRPSTTVADLRNGVLYSRMSWTKLAGFDLLEQSVKGTLPLRVDNGADLHALQQRAIQKNQDFYELMQGRQPLLTYALIAINVLVFLLEYAAGGPQSITVLKNFGALSPTLIEHGQWWRLFTAIFLHAGITHIAFNMTSLFVVGSLVERLYGRAQYLGIYLGAGLIGSIVSFAYAVMTNHTDVLGVGASGAIFGLAGALITARFHESDVIPQSVRNRVSSSVFLIVLLNFAFLFFVPYVDNSAHVGGLLGGVALSFLLPLTKQAEKGQVPPEL